METAEEMVQVQVKFVGICTFVSNEHQDVPLPQGVAWRVVLVNASQGREINGVLIDPHYATLQVGEKGTAEPLNGVTLSIVSTPPMNGPVTIGPGFSDVPNLTVLNADIAPISIPSGQMVLAEVPEFTAAYFDITGGTLEAAGEDVAISSMLTLSGPGGTVFSLKSIPYGETAGTATPLEPGTTVTISNKSRILPALIDADPAMSHFLLHYLVAEQFPPAPQMPVPPKIITDVPGSLGCSNSTYP